ncbi:MAG: hypothetical protein A2Z21_03890 [Candidatus Fraserbacteria bacterium RBG_16_55_9]|uniref:Uncharacterized protein n=1 Tax=Fraserbacteria sp. (strain RBG_16_55_9) TaxID=1817864 RepID=A0A1F5UXA3_FRAXR|nr:MAG: hypothetical protein A2Z21_03890 [Candidatus Fraserbacteria bacterium RBG_16_55_9]
MALAGLPLGGQAQPPQYPGDTDTDTIFLELLIQRGALLDVVSHLPMQFVITPEDATQRFKSLGELDALVVALTNYRVEIEVEVKPEAALPSGAFQARVREVLGPVKRVHAQEFTDLPGNGRPLVLFEGGNNAGEQTMAMVELQMDLRALQGSVPESHSIQVIVSLTEENGR